MEQLCFPVTIQTGTGARLLRIFGTDANYNLIQEDIEPNGTTAVPTVNSYTMIHEIEVIESGSTESNVGTITATAQIDGTLTAQIEPAIGKTQMAIYLVPEGFNLFITGFHANVDKSSGGSASVEIILRKFINLDGTEPSRQTIRAAAAESTNNPKIDRDLNSYGLVEPKSWVYIEIDTDVNNTVVSGGFSGYLRAI